MNRRLFLMGMSAAGQAGQAEASTAPVISAAPVIVSALLNGQLVFAAATATGTPSPSVTLTEVLDATGAVVASAAAATVSYVCQGGQVLRVRQTLTNTFGSAVATSAPATVTASSAPTIRSAKLLGANITTPLIASRGFQNVASDCRGWFDPATTGDGFPTEDELFATQAGQLLRKDGTIATTAWLFLFDAFVASLSGTYKVRHAGTANASVVGGSQYGTITNKVVSGGFTTFDLNLTYPSGIYAANDFAHMKVLFENMDAAWRLPTVISAAENQTGKFGAKLLQELSNFKVLRGMDWTDTNFPFRGMPYGDDGVLREYSETNWAIGQGATYKANKSAMTIESFIELCNTVGAEPWVNSSYVMSDAAIAAAVAKVHQLTTPGVRISFETYNELWNTSFPCGAKISDRVAGAAGIFSGAAPAGNRLLSVSRTSGVVTYVLNKASGVSVGQAIWAGNLVGKVSGVDTYLLSEPGAVSVASVSTDGKTITAAIAGPDFAAVTPDDWRSTIYLNPEHPYLKSGAAPGTRHNIYYAWQVYYADRMKVAFDAAVAVCGSRAAALARFNFVLGFQTGATTTAAVSMDHLQSAYGDNSWVGTFAVAPYAALPGDHTEPTLNTVDEYFDYTYAQWTDVRNKLVQSASEAAKYNVKITMYEWGVHWFNTYMPQDKRVLAAAALRDPRVGPLQKAIAADMLAVAGTMGCYFAIGNTSGPGLDGSSWMNFASMTGIIDAPGITDQVKHKSIVEITASPAETAGIDGVTHGNISLRRNTMAFFNWPTAGNSAHLGPVKSGLRVYCASAGTWRMSMAVGQGVRVTISADGGAAQTATQAANPGLAADIPPNMPFDFTLSAGHHNLSFTVDTAPSGGYAWMGPLVSFAKVA